MKQWTRTCESVLNQCPKQWNSSLAHTSIPVQTSAWISVKQCLVRESVSVSKTVKQWTPACWMLESVQTSAWITVKVVKQRTHACCLRETIVKISFLRLMHHFLEANLRLMHHSSLTSYNLLLRIRDLEHHELGLDYRPTAPTLVAWSGAGRYIHWTCPHRGRTSLRISLYSWV